MTDLQRDYLALQHEVEREFVNLILGVMLACDQRRFLMERLGVWRPR